MIYTTSIITKQKKTLNIYQKEKKKKISMAHSSPQINTTTLAINQMNTNKPRHGNRTNKVLDGVSNLLPTGTVLAFQTLMPSFSDGGSCFLTQKFLTGILIVLCAAACFFSSSPTVSSTKTGICTTESPYAKASTCSTVMNQREST